MSEEKKPNRLPEGWTLITLDQITGPEGIFTDGDWIESKDQNQNGTVKLIQLADIGDGFIRNRSNRYMTIEKANELNCTFLKKGDILIARMPDPIGRACIFPFEGIDSYVTVVDIAVVRCSSLINNKYIMYCLNSPSIRGTIEKKQTGTTRKRISRGNLAKIELPLPSREQQDAIVNKIEELFSELDKSIESLEKAKRQLEIYRQVLLKDAFEGKLTENRRKKNSNDSKPWKKTTLSKVGKLLSGQHILEKDYNTKSIGIPYLTGPSDFGPESPRVTRWTEYPKVEANPNTILITVKGSGVGKLNMLNFHAAIGRQIMSFDPLRNNKWFIYYFLQSQFKTIQRLSSGTAIPGISREHILSLLIPIVSEIEQNEIVRELQTQFSLIDNLEGTIQDHISKSELLKQAILNHAFRGQLVSQIEFPTEDLLEKIKVEKENYLMESKNKVSKTSRKDARKKLADLILEKFSNDPFTYEDLYREINLPYDELKNQLFELLDLNRLSSTFDKKKEQIFYMLLK